MSRTQERRRGATVAGRGRAPRGGLLEAQVEGGLARVAHGGGAGTVGFGREKRARLHSVHYRCSATWTRRSGRAGTA